MSEAMLPASLLTATSTSSDFLQPASVALEIHLAADRAVRLSKLAQARHLSQGKVIEQALDILFSLTTLLGETNERQAWSRLSEASLYRVWDNEQDAAYDRWRELYGLREE